jgi:hypothetical protein
VLVVIDEAGAGVVNDQLRARWLAAIAELGGAGAQKDAAQAFVQRTGCTLDEGYGHVKRAWNILSLS